MLLLYQFLFFFTITSVVQQNKERVLTHPHETFFIYRKAFLDVEKGASIFTKIDAPTSNDPTAFFCLYFLMPNASFPGNTAASPSSSSILNSWLYFATRSLRLGAPVLIWQVFSATARSAIVVSSVSPER